MIYKLNIDDFEGLSAKKVQDQIYNSHKIPLEKLKLFDLLLNDKQDTAMRHGVYMFFNDNNECLYAGMCSSSHFAHRIGGHFGMSPKYGMNTFLKRVVKDLNPNVKSSYPHYVDALKSISNYGLLLIGTNGKSKTFIKKLEKAIHIIFKTRLNFPKGFPKTYKELKNSGDFLSNLPKD